MGKAMTDVAVSHDVSGLFKTAEQEGLKLAIKGRLIALHFVGGNKQPSSDT
jgi:hypothetical protein